MLTVTKIFHFEAAHALSNHRGKCRNIHGHSYALHVRVSAPELNDQDMIVDFADLKRLVKEQVIADFDHALVLKSGHPLVPALKEMDHKLIITEAEPTAEVMVGLMAERIAARLPAACRLDQVDLYETGTSFATWTPGP